MSIEYDEKTKTLTVDQETVDRLTTGTELQRQVARVAEIEKIMAEDEFEMMAEMGIPRSARKKLAKKARANRAKFLLENPPPGVDPRAVEIFYSDKTTR